MCNIISIKWHAGGYSEAVAQLLMHSDPDLILAEVLLHHIAAQQGLPSKPEMLNACNA